jgi:hypothetical protein
MLSQRSAEDCRSVETSPGAIANALASKMGLASASSDRPTTGSTRRAWNSFAMREGAAGTDKEPLTLLDRNGRS